MTYEVLVLYHQFFLLLKIELLHVNQSLKPSKIHSTGAVLIDLSNKTDFTASKLDLLSMLGNMLKISKPK